LLDGQAIREGKTSQKIRLRNVKTLAITIRFTKTVDCSSRLELIDYDAAIKLIQRTKNKINLRHMLLRRIVVTVK
jgi:hypothetical protein